MCVCVVVQFVNELLFISMNTVAQSLREQTNKGKCLCLVLKACADEETGKVRKVCTPRSKSLCRKETHIMSASSLLKLLNLLRSLSNYGSSVSPTLFTLYNSRKLPCRQYINCSIVWASTYSIRIPPLLGLQKKSYSDHNYFWTFLCTLTQFFKTLHILDIFKIYKHQVSLSIVFIFKDNLHKYSHRYSFSLRVQGPKI